MNEGRHRRRGKKFDLKNIILQASADDVFQFDIIIIQSQAGKSDLVENG